MRNMARWTLICVLAVGACNDSDLNVDPIEVDHTPLTPEDNLKITDLAVDEFAIVAETTDGALSVKIPIDVRRDEALSATVTVSVGRIDEAPQTTAEAVLVLNPGLQTIELPVSGVTLPGSQVAQVGWILDYAIATEQGTARGIRSLYYAAPKYALKVWAPMKADAGTSTSVRVWAAEMETGRPLEAALVSVKGGSSATTDFTGQASLSLDVVGEDGAVEVTLKPVGGLPVTVTRPLEIVAEGAPGMFLSTDKPLYRPGQTMELRTLMLASKDRKPVSDEEVVFEVLDGKGTKVFREVAQTNEFGVASMRAALAKQVNVGDYLVRVSSGDLVEERAVEVTEQKLPAFLVEVVFDKPYFAPDELVTGNVQARYFFGQPVKDAVVNLATGQLTFNGTTDATGLMPFTFQGQGSVGSLDVAVEVTDTAGFAVATETQATIARSDLSVSLVPEAAAVPLNSSWQLYVLTRGPTGAPVDATCTRAGAEGSIATGSDGVGTMTIDDGQTGLVEVSCTFDALVGNAQVPSPAADWSKVSLRTDKTLYQPGEGITITVTGRDGVVFVDRLYRGRIVESQESQISDGATAVTFSPSKDEVGTQYFIAYWVDDEGELVSAQRTAFVRAEGAKVSVSSDKESYLPGTEATLTFKVTDESGVGQPAAIGVAIADEAVFALAGATSPTDVQAHFVLEGVPAALRPYALNTDQQELQDRAAAALAAANEPLQASVFGEDQAHIQSEGMALIRSLLGSRASSVRQQLQQMENDGTFSSSNASEVAERLDFVDPWGQPFTFEASVRDYGWGAEEVMITMRSAGPSETPGTWDDWSFNLWFYQAASESGSAADTSAGPSPNADPSVNEDSGLDGEAGAGGAKAPRDDFKETLFVDPCIITDGSGEATVTIPLADNITSWRVAMIANSSDGLLGGGTGNITVFQDFFVDVDLPKKLTVDDRLDLPVGIYNFSEVDQTISVVLAQEEWFEVLVPGDESQAVTIPAGESVALPIGIRVTQAGARSVTLTATGPTMSDGVVRTTSVVPNGQYHETSQSGPLDGSFTAQIDFPGSALAGGNDALLKIMGSPSAQMVDGVDALLQVPRGCFEPMMNSTWINGLVLDYLQLTGSDNKELMASAKANLDDGLQQSVTFECTGGGFTWFGDPDPAHPILTAFALMMFADFEGLTSVDENLVSRAQGRLVDTQNGDGSWDTQLHTKNQVVPWDTLRTTCVVAWGLGVSNSSATQSLSDAFGYIKAQDIPASDTYTLSMCANALLALEPDDPATDAAVAELLSRANTEVSGRAFFGSQDPGVTLAQGDVIAVETTAVAVQALFKMATPPTLVEDALKWLSEQKSPNGNFLSTQGTIQALRGFVAAAEYGSGDTNATVTVTAGGQQLFSADINADNKDVVHFVSLTNQVTQGGAVDVQVDLQGEGKLLWQLTSQHYTPWGPGTRRTGPAMDIDVTYSPTSLTLGQSTTATLTVTTTGTVSPNDMPMVEFPIPPGFDVDTTDLDAQAATDPRVARHETKDGVILVYLHEVPADQGPLVMKLTLKPRQAMEVAAPVSKTYPFYEPGKTSESEPVTLTVTAP